jgi:hypothetical protein
LSEEQSAAIRESGITFAVMGPGSSPAATGRSVIYLFECANQQAVDAFGVAIGSHIATRISDVTAATPATTTAAPTNTP